MQGLGSSHISQWGWNPQKALLETVLERIPSCVPVSPKLLRSQGHLSLSLRPQSHRQLSPSPSPTTSATEALQRLVPLRVRTLEASHLSLGVT